MVRLTTEIHSQIKQTLDERSWAGRREPFRSSKRSRVLGQPEEAIVVEMMRHRLGSN